MQALSPIGIYLHGSIALGAFNEHASDIDFVTVLHAPATASEIDYLRRIHKEIAAAYPRWGMDGSYLQWSDLGKFEAEIAPYPYYHDGVLHPHGYHEINAVTWWILKNHGIALMDAPPLAFEVDWDVLIQRMWENLHTYWADWAKNPLRMGQLMTDTGFQWAVLGVLRQYYTFRENDITSKIGAGEYGLRQFSDRWKSLILEAIHLRERKEGRCYSSRVIRALHTVQFLRFIIRECEVVYPGNKRVGQDNV